MTSPIGVSFWCLFLSFASPSPPFWFTISFLLSCPFHTPWSLIETQVVCCPSSSLPQVSSARSNLGVTRFTSQPTGNLPYSPSKYLASRLLSLFFIWSPSNLLNHIPIALICHPIFPRVRLTIIIPSFCHPHSFSLVLSNCPCVSLLAHPLSHSNKFPGEFYFPISHF